MKYWITQQGEKLKIREMTESHILNCIKMLERLLATKPEPSVYMGDSEYAEQAVELENQANDDKAEIIQSRINSFKRELKRRVK